MTDWTHVSGEVATIDGRRITLVRHGVDPCTVELKADANVDIPAIGEWLTIQRSVIERIDSREPGMRYEPTSVES
ncbi:MAG: hypothetical protein M3457_01150 [Chloroflexota bacterium]|nr:hypothetical protein [Chloroflexota bacterium]